MEEYFSIDNRQSTIDNPIAILPSCKIKMMRIISVSRRTDIPSFYTKWFMNRIRDGFCHWINPFGGQVYRVSLQPEDCLALVFWTRNPTPLIRHLDFLRREGYRFYFHFTINGYPKILESHNPPAHTMVAALQRLADLISPELTFWRYDPILLNEVTSEAYHLKQFDFLSRQLEGYTNRCYFSYVAFYGKTERNLRWVEREHNLSFQRPSIEEQRHLAHQLRDIGATRGITLYSCCHDGLIGDGIEKAHCIDSALIARLRPDLNRHLQASPTRQDCGCAESVDIGAYDTCPYGCVYCYANHSRDIALRRMRAHDPNDTVLWRPSTLRTDLP
ncbi:DUF1848 domain-containing protein [Candidatus Poribacteria bacterium]|nr:DUF1848 domain-containing protein [Candidatus Poribacteria bacterium]